MSSFGEVKAMQWRCQSYGMSVSKMVFGEIALLHKNSPAMHWLHNGTSIILYLISLGPWDACQGKNLNF